MCWKLTEVCEEIHQLCKIMSVCYVCCYFGLILNLDVEGGSADHVVGIFDYALGLLAICPTYLPIQIVLGLCRTYIDHD